MSWHRVAVEMGMGTSLLSGDHTAAAVAALENALSRSSLTITEALGQNKDSLKIDIIISVPSPSSVNKTRITSMLEQSNVSCSCVVGGMSIPSQDECSNIIIANAAALFSVYIPTELTQNLNTPTKFPSIQGHTNAHHNSNIRQATPENTFINKSRTRKTRARPVPLTKEISNTRPKDSKSQDLFRGSSTNNLPVVPRNGRETSRNDGGMISKRSPEPGEFNRFVEQNRRDDVINYQERLSSSQSPNLRVNVAKEYKNDHTEILRSPKTRGLSSGGGASHIIFG